MQQSPEIQKAQNQSPEIHNFQAPGIQSILRLTTITKGPEPDTKNSEWQISLHMELFMGKNVDGTKLFSPSDYQERENKQLALKTKNVEFNRPITMNANRIRDPPLSSAMPIWCEEMMLKREICPRTFYLVQ